MFSLWEICEYKSLVLSFPKKLCNVGGLDKEGIVVLPCGGEVSSSAQCTVAPVSCSRLMMALMGAGED